jgi:hypothetical protein
MRRLVHALGESGKQTTERVSTVRAKGRVVASLILFAGIGAPVSVLLGAVPSGGGGDGAVDLPSRWQELLLQG